MGVNCNEYVYKAMMKKYPVIFMSLHTKALFIVYSLHMFTQ